MDFGDDVLSCQSAHEAVAGFVAWIVGLGGVVIVVEGVAWWSGWDVLVVVVFFVGTFVEFRPYNLVDHVVHCCVHGR